MLWQQVAATQWRERHVAHLARMTSLELPRNFERDPCLAGAARTCDGEQARGTDQPDEFGKLAAHIRGKKEG